MKRLLFLIIALNLCVWSSALQGQTRTFTKVWDGGLGGADPDGTGPLPKNLVRAWGMIGAIPSGPIDIDKDGKNEFISYDATLKRVFVWESTGDNAYEVAWHKDKDVEGASILVGSERSVMITDLDEDGNLELVMIWDAHHPDSTNGFNAMEIFEHDASGFLPDTPTLTYDPPRSEAQQIRLEFMSVATDVDGDGVVELILTYRDGKNVLLSIISLPGKDFASPDWIVEYVDSTTTTDSLRFGKKVHSMTVGDLDGDGNQDMLVQCDGDYQPIVVYTATDANTYELVMFNSSVYHKDYKGSAAKMIMADMDDDGTKEVYLGARGGKIWVVSGITDIATAFDSTNFTLIANLLPEDISKPELRGGALGDADHNGKVGFYVTARDPLESVIEYEWLGGVGGDVTDPDNYQEFSLYNDDNTDDITVGMVAMAIGDFDGDGVYHQDIVFVTGNGNEGIKPGIFLIEFDATTAIDSRGSQTPESFALHQNYPNPFNPATSIVYELFAAGDVKLVIYNILGQEVRTLFSGHKSMGRHEALWDGNDHEGKSMVSGIYYYTLESSGFKETRKMLLLK
ncbi:hypothetical protein ES703_52136 [subsurface metagenome]